MRTAENAVRCDKCHKGLVPAGASITVKHYPAVAYTEAMHRLCIGCHVKKAQEKSKPEMGRCDWCHKEKRNVLDASGIRLEQDFVGRGVVLPAPANSQ